MKPHSHETHIQHTFDAFCKKVLRNEARDCLDEITRRSNRGIPFSEFPVEIMEQISVCDSYFKKDRTFNVWDHAVYIESDELAEAIAALPDKKRDVILLAYFLDMSDYEIARTLNVERRAVTYRRTNTLKLLKELMGGEQDDK